MNYFKTKRPLSSIPIYICDSAKMSQFSVCFYFSSPFSLCAYAMEKLRTILALMLQLLYVLFQWLCKEQPLFLSCFSCPIL